jgi:hypothetical protein
MTTKRTPIHREARTQITPEAADLYRKICCELAPTYLGCLRKSCPNRSAGRGCDTCREHHKLSGKLHNMLGLKPWHFPLSKCEPPEEAMSSAKLATWWQEALAEVVEEALEQAGATGRRG